MDRTSAPGATIDRRFTDGDPSSGTPATDVDATWANLVQEELVTPILKSGRVLDPTKTDQLMQSIIDLVYRIGDYIQSENDDATPVVRFPWQTWVEVKGVVLVGRDAGQAEFNVTGKTGGEKTHKLALDEMPRHSHKMFSNDGTTRPPITANNYAKADGLDGSSDSEYSMNGSDVIPSLGNTGTAGGAVDGTAAHNNLQPYRVVRLWRRTA